MMTYFDKKILYSVAIRDIERILIIRTDGIGDVLNSTPAISALRKTYQNAHISVLASPWGAEILLLNPLVDGILVYDPNNLHRSLTARLRLIMNLRSKSYDMAVIFYNSSMSNLMAYLSGARYRIGRWSERKRFSSTLTHGVGISDPKGTKHEVDRNMDVARFAGAKDETNDLVLCLSEEEELFAKDFLNNRESLHSNLVGIHPGGSSFDKLWPEESFADIANRLMQEFGAKIILFSGPGEENLAHNIQKRMTHPPITASGLRLRQLAALIERCSLFICNDSGPMHIAAALKIPTVAIFGPTDHVRWKPRNENAVIVRKDMDCWHCSAHKCKKGFECIKTLPVDDVWNAIGKVYSQLSS